MRVPRLTFDDGPSEYTAPLLDVLGRYDVKATFFVLGVHAQALPDLVVRADREGHTIGSHAWDHAGLDELQDEDIRAKLKPASALIEKLIGERPTLCRPPYGRSNVRVERIANDLGMKLVPVGLVTRDHERPGVDAIADAIVRAPAGQIVLLHDGAEPGTANPDRSQTVAAVDRALLALTGHE